MLSRICSHHCGGGAAPILEHGDLCAGHLAAAGLSAQLQYRFDGLVHTHRADGIAARFAAAHGADGDLAARDDRAVLRQLPTFAGFGETGSFEGQGGIHRIGVIQFEQVHICRGDARLGICPPG